MIGGLSAMRCEKALQTAFGQCARAGRKVSMPNCRELHRKTVCFLATSSALFLLACSCRLTSRDKLPLHLVPKAETSPAQHAQLVQCPKLLASSCGQKWATNSANLAPFPLARLACQWKSQAPHTERRTSSQKAEGKSGRKKSLI